MTSTPLSRVIGKVTVTRTSPDGQLEAALTIHGQLDLRLRCPHYTRYDRADLEHQLTVMMTEVFMALHREHRALVERTKGGPLHSGPETWSDGKASYRQQLNRLVGKGNSRNGWVEAASQGLTRWKFRLNPKATNTLSLTEVLQEAHSAVGVVIIDHKQQHAELIKQLTSSDA